MLIEYRSGESTLLRVDDESSGLADLPLSLGYQLTASDQGAVAGWLTIKVPTGKAADRKIYGDVIESVLYDSADSYAQMRLLYLQNRRYKLSGQENNDANSWDPYTDPQ